MATIANLAVSVTARIGSFEKGLNKAIKMTKRFSRDLIHHISTITKYAAAIVSAGIVIGSYLVKQQFEAIDKTGKLADLLGLTTEQLTGYQHAADLSGVSQEQLNKALTKFEKNIGDAENKTKASVDAFAKLGLTWQQLKALNTDQQIKLVADRYQGLNNTVDNTNVLLALFGRSGMMMGKVLEAGSKGLAEAQAEAKRLGLSFSELDFRKVEMANDAITRLKAILTGAARVIAVNLAPFILAAAERLQEMSLQGGSMGEVVTNAFNWVLRAAGRLADYWELLKAGAYGFQWAVLTVVRVIAQAFTLPMRTMQKMSNYMISLVQKFAGTKIGGKMTRALGIDPADLEKYKSTAVEDFIDAYKTESIEAFDKMAAALQKFIDKTHSKDATVLFEKIKQRAEELARTLGGNNKLLQDAQDIASGKTAMARRIDLSSTVLGSFKDKGPTLKQGEQMVSYLKVIAGNTKREAAVVVS